MRNLLILLFILPLTLYSQKVYSVKYSNQSDVKLYVVEYENQCDLKEKVPFNFHLSDWVDMKEYQKKHKVYWWSRMSKPQGG